MQPTRTHERTNARAHRAHARTKPDPATEVQEILDQIAVAITAGDGETVAGLWALPAFIIGPTMEMAISDEDALVKLFAAGREQYTKQGITDTRAEILALEWIGKEHEFCVAQVRWPYLDDGGRRIGSERSDYMFRRDDSGALKVRMVLMRGVEGGKQ
jgi:hypothetical protein